MIEFINTNFNAVFNKLFGENCCALSSISDAYPSACSCQIQECTLLISYRMKQAFCSHRAGGDFCQGSSGKTAWVLCCAPGSSRQRGLGSAWAQLWSEPPLPRSSVQFPSTVP